MIRRFALASAILIAAASATPAMAGTATSNLNVGANVTNNCTISTTPISFGNYNPASANPLDQTGSVTITCTTGASATIKLNQGSNRGTGSTDAAPVRRLTHIADNGNYLAYQIYQDSNRSTVWGNTAGTGVSETGNGAAQVKTVYGRIDAGQNVAAGAYSDTVVAEVAF